MASTSLDSIIQACREWLKLAATGAGLTDAQVIVADDPGVRPVPPFATVRVVVFDNPVGTDFEHFDDSDPPLLHISGGRQDTVSIQTFGIGAAAWLQEASLGLRKQAVRDQLTAAGFDIEPLGGMQNLTAVLDTDFEERFQRDYLVSYRVHATTEARTEGVQFQVEVEADGTPLTTLTIP